MGRRIRCTLAPGRLFSGALGLTFVVAISCAAPLEVGDRVTGVGISTGLPMHAMMPTIAENRALDALRRMLIPGAVRFTYDSASGFAILDTQLPEAPLVSGGAELIPIRGGWMAVANAQRDPRVVAFMRQLPTQRVHSEVVHSNLGTALRLAESRAIRAAIRTAAVQVAGGEGRFTGSLTVAAMRVTFPKRGVRVEMLVFVAVEDHEPIDDAQRRRILVAVADERQRVREWEAALEPLRTALTLYPDDAELHARLGELLLDADDSEEAAAAFGRAAELAPQNIEYARRQRIARGEVKPEDMVPPVACRRHGDQGSNFICGDRICDADGMCSLAFFSVAAGGAVTCGVTLEGRLACWGDAAAVLGDVPDGRFARVAVGAEHACGLDTEGEAVCWGEDEEGQASPPDGTFLQLAVGSAAASCGVTSRQTLVCWGRGSENGLRPPEGSFKQVVVGAGHACALALDGSVRCWGDDESGQASPPDGSFSAIVAGDRHTCGLRGEGRVECWGADDADQLAAPDALLVQIAAGALHTCGVDAEGAVSCWGGGASAQTCGGADGTCGQAEAPVGRFSHVAAGEHHTCGLQEDGFAVCWGRADGERLTPPQEIP